MKTNNIVQERIAQTGVNNEYTNIITQSFPSFFLSQLSRREIHLFNTKERWSEFLADVR